MFTTARPPATRPTGPRSRSGAKTRDEIARENNRLFGTLRRKLGPIGTSPDHAWLFKIAYLTAIDLYDPREGALSTYLYRWVRRAAQQARAIEAKYAAREDDVSTLDIWRATI